MPRKLIAIAFIPKTQGHSKLIQCIDVCGGRMKCHRAHKLLCDSLNVFFAIRHNESMRQAE